MNPSSTEDLTWLNGINTSYLILTDGQSSRRVANVLLRYIRHSKRSLTGGGKSPATRRVSFLYTGAMERFANGIRTQMIHSRQRGRRASWGVWAMISTVHTS